MPETGQQFEGSNWPQLHERLTAHYKAAGYPMPGNMFELVEKFICDKEPGYCVGSPEDAPRFSLANTFTNVLAGTRTFLRGALTLGEAAIGGKFVPQEKAEARAAVCVVCAYNDDIQGCTGCNMPVMREAVELLVGKRTTTKDAQLRACRICSCHLQGKVHIALTPLLRHMPEEQRAQLPPHCWLMSEAKESK